MSKLEEKPVHTMNILRLITLFLLVSSSHAASLYHFNYYDVYSKALELANTDHNANNYELYNRDSGFTKDNNEFILSFFLKYKVNGPKKFNYLCLKINASGNLVEIKRDIKPVYNDPNKPSDSCYISNERSNSIKHTIYDVNYKTIEAKFNQLLNKNRTAENLITESRTRIYSFMRQIKGEPKLYVGSYYKYKSSDQVLYACHIINENGEVISFLENIPEKFRTSYFSTAVSKPSYHCKFNESLVLMAK